jgi:hypothetical protein
VNVDNVSRDDWILGGLALLLAIGLLAFPWFDISVGPFSTSFSATSTPDGWLGILAFIAALAVIVDLAIERFSPQTTLPSIGGGRPHTRFILAAIAAVFVALKFLFHIHFGLFGWGFYVDVILTVALVYVAMQARSGAPLRSGRGPVGRSGPPPAI